jgi:hypothetical protein
MFNGNFEQARRYCESALKLATEIRYSQLARFAQGMLAVLDCLENENYSLGKQTLEPSPGTGLDSEFAFLSAWGYSLASWGVGDLPASKQAIHASLTMALASRSHPLVLFCLPIVVAILAEEGPYETAVELLAASLENILSPNQWMGKTPFIRQISHRLQENVPGVQFKLAWESGKSRDLDWLTRICLDLTAPRPGNEAESNLIHRDVILGLPAQELVETLTEREMEVLHWLVQGLTPGYMTGVFILAIVIVEGVSVITR